MTYEVPVPVNTHNHFSCLIVDDDPGFTSMLTRVVQQHGGRVTGCGDLKSARGEIGRAVFDVVVLDNRLPDGTGYEFYSELERICPRSIVMMITAHDFVQFVLLT